MIYWTNSCEYIPEDYFIRQLINFFFHLFFLFLTIFSSCFIRLVNKITKRPWLGHHLIIVAATQWFSGLIITLLLDSSNDYVECIRLKCVNYIVDFNAQSKHRDFIKKVFYTVFFFVLPIWINCLNRDERKI